MINAYAALAANQPLEPFQYDPGALKAHEVEIKVSHCGICHSDLSMLNNEWGMTQYPFVPGHEIVGTIDAVGEAVTHLSVGQVVGLGWHSNYCHHCMSCYQATRIYAPRHKVRLLGGTGASLIKSVPMPVP